MTTPEIPDYDQGETHPIPPDSEMIFNEVVSGLAAIVQRGLTENIDTPANELTDPNL